MPFNTMNYFSSILFNFKYESNIIVYSLFCLLQTEYSEEVLPQWISFFLVLLKFKYEINKVIVCTSYFVLL